jgi:YVTN family beta-propeller protein
MKYLLAAVLSAALLPVAAADAADPGYKLINRVKVPDGGFDYGTFDPVAHRVYFARADSTTAIDPASGAVTRLASASGGHMALPIPGTHLLLLPQRQGKIRLVDAVTDMVVADLPAGMNPDGAVYDPLSKLVFVMNHGSGESTVVDPATRMVVATIPVGGTLEFAVSDGAGKVFVNVEDQNQIAVIDVKTRKVTDRYRLADCDGPTGLAYDAPNKLLIASCDGTAKVVDAASGKEVASLKIGGGPDAVIYDGARRLAFIPAGEDGVLEVISLADKAHIAVVQHVPTQRGARTGTIDPQSGRIFLIAAKPDPAAPAGRGGARLAGSYEVLVVGK